MKKEELMVERENQKEKENAQQLYTLNSLITIDEGIFR